MGQEWVSYQNVTSVNIIGFAIVLDRWGHWLMSGACLSETVRDGEFLVGWAREIAVTEQNEEITPGTYLAKQYRLNRT